MKKKSITRDKFDKKMNDIIYDEYGVQEKLIRMLEEVSKYEIKANKPNRVDKKSRLE